jgi:hypothetical protein
MVLLHLSWSLFWFLIFGLAGKEYAEACIYGGCFGRVVFDIPRARATRGFSSRHTTLGVINEKTRSRTGRTKRRLYCTKDGRTELEGEPCGSNLGKRSLLVYDRTSWQAEQSGLRCQALSHIGISMVSLWSLQEEDWFSIKKGLD